MWVGEHHALCGSEVKRSSRRGRVCSPPSSDCRGTCCSWRDARQGREGHMNMVLNRSAMFFLSLLTWASEYHHQSGGISCSGSEPLKVIYLFKKYWLRDPSIQKVFALGARVSGGRRLHGNVVWRDLWSRICATQRDEQTTSGERSLRAGTKGVDGVWGQCKLITEKKLIIKWKSQLLLNEHVSCLEMANTQYLSISKASLGYLKYGF